MCCELMCLDTHFSQSSLFEGDERLHAHLLEVAMVGSVGLISFEIFQEVIPVLRTQRICGRAVVPEAEICFGVLRGASFFVALECCCFY